MFDPTGLLVPGATYLVGLLGLLAVHAARRTSAPGWRRWRWALAALFAWSWIFSSPGLADIAVSALEGAPSASLPAGSSADAPVVVVMGSGRLYARVGTPAPRLDASGWERFQVGLSLWRRMGGTLVLTGGPVPEASLAGIMRNAALDAGVPPDRIRLAAASRNTHEDLVAVARGQALPGQRVLLVTSALHMPRALRVAQQLGLAAEAVPCDYRQLGDPTWRAYLPDDGGPALWAAVMHEWVGLAFYRMRGFTG